MKTGRIVISLCLLSTLAFSQDWMTRIGGTTGGNGVAHKPSQEAGIKAKSAESPIPIKASKEQFETYCLDRATLDADVRAVYVANSDGYIRQVGIGNRYVKIIQRISDSFFLASSGDRFIAIKSDSDNLIDDHSYELSLTETGETYTYTTVIGASKRVLVYKMREFITKDQILARFLAGESFVLPIPKTTTTPCVNCEGSGFITVKDGPGGARNTLCPVCNGKRKITLTCDLIHSVSIDKRSQPQKTP